MTDDRDPVDVLAEEFADRLRRGEHPSVGDYAAAHPAHADQLRELLPAVAQMEFLKRFRRAAGPETVELPDRFGDFRIVRELGRGGMGVVFEAVQESLGRPVALKVLATHAQLDPTRRERFVREAQAAAKLHHTNIVPVFGVGEQDGIPYYVMQLIRGDGLHAVARRWRLEQGKETAHAGSTVEYGKADTRETHPGVDAPGPPAPAEGPRYGDWAFVAEVGLQTANALHYAHQQGVLHRDVKPANLILDPAGRVWVADFGLAKLVNLHGLTATGDILGTLQYLAPECLHGDSDPRSDVYGLGATLYELLTLQPPHAADSPAKLVKLVAEATPPAPRQLNPAVPRDLETIVLKAMAREPHRRYVGPRELAADLQAFLEDRPITARRESWAGRAWRACRRNPLTALLGAGVAAALLLAGGVGWAGYANTTRALDAEAKRREEADQARADAVQAAAKLEANLRLSLKAFGDVFEAAGGTRTGYGTGPWTRPLGPDGPDPGGWLFWGGPGGGRGGRPGGTFHEHRMVALPGPGGPDRDRGPGAPPPKGPGGGPFGETAADNAAILDALLAFYDQFAEQNATNKTLQMEAAKAHRRVGEMRSWLRDPDRATASLRRAAAQLEDLRARYPDDADVRAELVLTVLVRTFVTAPDGRFPADTEKELLRALDLARTLKDGPRAYLAGSVWLRLGLVREQARDATGAEDAYRAAVAGLAAPKEGDDTRPPPVVGEQSMARTALAWLLTRADRLPEARAVLAESVAELRAATARPAPGPRLPREMVGMALLESARVCDKMNDRDAAEAARAEAEGFMPKFGGFGGPKWDGPPRKK